jgi:NAD(P)-dependent dehydrogenase (short-subunit alcohol dehydrogenase family)
MRKLDLTDAVVLITGGTGGLGTALARELTARGARLALFGRDQDAATAQATSLGGIDRALGGSVDVRDMHSVERAVAATIDRFGRIDVVIAAAGVESAELGHRIDPDRFERDIDINLTGVWRTYRAAFPHLEHTRGHFLAISSMAAFVHSPRQASYTASKAGVWALCDSLRIEARPHRVSVGTAFPTFFQTPMLDQLQRDPELNTIWNGNTRGIWKPVPIEHVIHQILDGLQHRRRNIVIPRRNKLATTLPGAAQWMIERALRRSR